MSEEEKYKIPTMEVIFEGQVILINASDYNSDLYIIPGEEPPVDEEAEALKYAKEPESLPLDPNDPIASTLTPKRKYNKKA